MEIRKTYIGTINGVSGIWCGFKPDDAIIIDEKLILYPQNDYLLKNKMTEEVVYSVCLTSQEQQEDWEEIPFTQEDLDADND